MTGRILFTGFRGTRNASGLLAEQLSGDCCLLTNSFAGLERDIEAISREAFDYAVMFGVDRELAGTVRLERVADKDGVRYASSLDLETIAASIRAAGLGAVKLSLVFPILFFSLSFFALITEKGFLIFPCYFWISAFKRVYLNFYPLPFASLLSTAIAKASSDSYFAFLHFFFLGMVLIPVSSTMS